MKRSVARRRAAAVLACVGLVTFAAPALDASAATRTLACTPTQLAAVKGAVGAAVARRDATLTALASKLATRPHLTSGHASALTSLYGSDKAGLDAVNATVQADTTCAAVHADAQAVVTSYRVYLLVVPQSGLTLAGDSGSYGASAFAATEPAIRLAIKAMPAGSAKDQAQRLYDSLAASVAAAQSDFAGVGDAVLALTPAGYPGNAPTLTAQAQRVRAGTTALAGAVSDAEQLQALLT